MNNIAMFNSSVFKLSTGHLMSHPQNHFQMKILNFHIFLSPFLFEKNFWDETISHNSITLKSV